ncbi:MAG: hypothetical protein KTR29_09065 [Rhodothermaceae bacterium]|nr:hypothetical protein [Rhodothermaceae bacterium]
MADIKSNSFLFWLGDPLRATKDEATESYRFTGGSAWWVVPLVVGAVLLLASFAGGFADHKQFFFSYLVAWSFCLSITLGALFFVVVQHLTHARWSVVVRRLAEALIWAFPFLAVLGIPIILGMHDLYHWTHEELLDPTDSHYDPLIAGKVPYLNTPFFIGRLVLYFLVWTFISHRLYTLSIKQDINPDASIRGKQYKISAIGLVLFAVTTAFAAFDILMSLDPHWFSTIFGIYFFAGSFVSALALMIFSNALIQKRGGMLEGIVTTEHYHDLGKLMFGMTVFWAYIAFSQYMLIWYGGIPEETIWYRHRLEHGWEYHSAVLLVAHFIIPFIILLPRGNKRFLPLLTFMSVWMLIMHWFDLHWLAMPILDLAQNGHAGFHWLDFTTWIGLFMAYFGLFMYRLSRHSLVPKNDAHLGASLRFTNS